MLRDFTQRHARWLGAVGAACIMAGAFLAARGYVAEDGSGYSFLNRAISALGDPRGSRWSFFFNGGQIVGSLFMVLFIYGVGSRLNTRRSPRITRVGMYGAVGMGLVGLFPDAPPTHALHLIVSAIAFVCTLALGASFTADILVTEQEVLPRWLIVPGFVTALCSGVFLASTILTGTKIVPHSALQFGHAGARPMVDLVFLSEWSVLFSILMWSLLTAAAVRPNRVADAEVAPQEA